MALRDSDGPFTQAQVLDELRKQGVTNLDELAQKIAEASAAKARFNQARGISPNDNVAYLWSGPNYSLHHLEVE